MNRKELKSLARLQISGKILMLFVIVLIADVLVSLCSVIPVAGTILGIILGAPLSLAIIYIHFRIASDPNYRPRISELFSQFDKNFWPFLKVTLLSALFTFLWSLLLIVPGIIKAISYSQAPYIIAENPNMPAMEAIRLSEQMMKGNKMDYFVLELSFIGWALLSIPTLGLLLIWLEPYMSMTFVNYYFDLKARCGVSFQNAPPPPPPPFGEQI